MCPWNRKAPPGREAELDARPEWSDPDLIEWLTLSAAEWKARLKGTALARAKRAGLLRNAALVLGTRGSTEAIAPLVSSSGRLLGRRLGSRLGGVGAGPDRHERRTDRPGAAPR